VLTEAVRLPAALSVMSRRQAIRALSVAPRERVLGKSTERTDVAGLPVRIVVATKPPAS
jgi:hypothetical protein